MAGPTCSLPMRRLVSPLVLLLPWSLLACRDDFDRRRNPDPIPTPTCGDGRIDPGEECDGSNLGDATCVSKGFESGSLVCSDSCALLTSACVKRCGNGVLDPGEACDGATGPLGCDTWGYKRCGPTCQVDPSHCGARAVDTAPALQLTKGGFTAVIDLAPLGAADLVVAVPSFLRLETYPYTTEQGFQASARRTLSFQRRPLLPLVGDFDGDGSADALAIHDDGAIDRYLYTPASSAFRHEPVPSPDGGAGCAAFRWVGAGKLDGDAALDAVAVGCPSGAPTRGGALLVVRGGATARAPELTTQAGIVAAVLADADGDGLQDVLVVTEGSAELKVLRTTEAGFTAQAPRALPLVPAAFAAADLDGDGDLDLAARSGDNVALLENVGTSFAARTTFAAQPEAPQLVDLDLDGRVDVLWAQNDRVQLRRNLGGFQFLPFDGPTGPGTPVSLSAADLDGDGDPDLAVTMRLAPGGDETTTYVLVNKVR